MDAEIAANITCRARGKVVSISTRHLSDLVVCPKNSGEGAIQIDELYLRQASSGLQFYRL